MITFVLPGFSKSNRDWLDQVSEGISVDGVIRSISWDHWGEPKKQFVAKDKARIMSAMAASQKVNIVAKSISTLVASYMILNNPSQFQKIIFCGIPLNDLEDIDGETIKSALKLLDPKNIIIYQNSSDPHGSYDEVRKFVDKANPDIEIIKKEADNHDYFYIKEFNENL